MANTREISKEEEYMKIYFEELLEAGIISKIIYQPTPFSLFGKITYMLEKKLKTKSNFISKTLINDHIYTSDFKVIWNKEIPVSSKFHRDMMDVPCELPPFLSHNNECWIEVKSWWDNNNMTRLFTSRTQPWVYQKFGIYVNLIKVPDIFKETFIPTKILDDFYYKVGGKKFNKGDKKYKFEYRTLNEYLNG